VDLRVLQRLKALSTDFAVKWPIAGMVHNVQPQLNRPGKRLVAVSDGALEGFDPGMQSSVSRQVARPSKRLAAARKFTFVRLQPVVDDLVVR